MIACSGRRRRAHRTNENSEFGKTYTTAAEDMFGRIRPGRAGGRARYVKEVDSNEHTIRFAQEIYDSSGRLTAMHEKFPVDLGHKQL